MVSGGRTPILPADELKQISYGLAIHSGLSFLTAGEALRLGYGELLDSGNVTQQPVHDFDAFCRTFGFEDVWEFDSRWADPADTAAE
jgi:hypothetical protein